MAFPTDWGRRCALVIQSSKIGATESNFPVFLTKDTLPAEMFAVAGEYEALEGGGDIRFSSDEAGSSQLACDIVAFSLDDADDLAAIFVNVASIAHDADTTIYVWYKKAGESQPARDAAFGMEAVWESNYLGVWHLTETGDGTADEFKDSTSNDNHGTGDPEPDITATAKVYKAQHFNGSSDVIDLPAQALGGDTGTMSAWVKYDSATPGTRMVLGRWNSNDCIGTLNATPDEWYGRFSDVSAHIATPSVSTDWHYIVGTYDGGLGSDNIKLYNNGSNTISEDRTGNNTDETRAWQIGSNGSGGLLMDGIADEVRLSSTALTATWIATEYNNINDPATFVVEGTPESTTAADLNVSASECE